MLKANFNFKVQLRKFISMSCKEVTSIDNSILDKCTCKCGVKLKTNTHIVQLGEGVVGVLLMWGVVYVYIPTFNLKLGRIQKWIFLG
jgi:hypothetical protein